MDDFEKLLDWLDPRREKAIEKYENIRAKLIRFFQCRGCGVDAEELTDETIERVTKKVDELAGSYVGDPFRYFFGVARNVFREWLKKQTDLRNLPPSPTGDSWEEKVQKKRRHDCLGRCMEELTTEERDLLREYYTGDKQKKIVHRRELAERLDIAPNALRIRAHRIVSHQQRGRNRDYKNLT